MLTGAWLGHCEGEPVMDQGEMQDSDGGEFPWVRTVDGWERATWLEPKTGYRPALHPLVVALFVGLSATMGLLAFPPATTLQPEE